MIGAGRRCMFKSDDICGWTVEFDMQFLAVLRDGEFADAVLMGAVLTLLSGEQRCSAPGQQHREHCFESLH